MYVHACRSALDVRVYMYVTCAHNIMENFYQDVLSFFTMKGSDRGNPVSVTNVNLQLSVGKSHNYNNYYHSF